MQKHFLHYFAHFRSNMHIFIKSLLLMSSCLGKPSKNKNHFFVINVQPPLTPPPHFV